jgi:hypothetical protein
MSQDKAVATRRQTLRPEPKSRNKNKKRFLKGEAATAHSNQVNFKNLFAAVGLSIGIGFCSILFQALRLPDSLNHVWFIFMLGLVAHHFGIGRIREILIDILKSIQKR